jgi:hypothetical protein
MILQRVALYPQMRLDVPDARALEAFGQNDFVYFIKGMLTTKSSIISGFEITNYPNIFTIPGVTISQNNVSLFHPEATTQAAGFYVSSGSESDFRLILSSNNSGLTTNYVEADLTTSTGSPDTRAFWDQGANGNKGSEYTDTVDTVINLELAIDVNISGFTPGRIPLYKVITNPDGTVNTLTDCRSMFFRLGTGGTSPDADADFNFPNSPDSAHSRFEPSSTSKSATASNVPFQGGDKNIKTLKQWMDAVMTLIKESNATPYWYMKPQSSLAGIYQNAALTLLTGGVYSHLGFSDAVISSTATSLTTSGAFAYNSGPSSFIVNGTTYNYSVYSQSTGKFTGVSPNPSTIASGSLVTQGDIGHMTMNDGSIIVRMGQTNSTTQPFTNINLTTNTTLFVLLSKDNAAVTYGMGEDGLTPIIPKDISAVTSNSITVPTGGNYIESTANLLIRGQEFSYSSYNPSTGLFSDVSPDPSGLAKVSDTVFQEISNGGGFYHASPAARVPGVIGTISEGAERVFWIAYYDGVNTIFVRDAELVPGESAKAGDANSNQTYEYIGSSGAADNFPIYDVASVPNGTNLTDAIEKAFNIIETPIYDEVVTDSMSTGWANSAIIFLPANSKTSTTGSYTLGTDELQVYENGILLRNGYDYNELTSTSIQLLRSIYTGSYLRFRISSVGGAGSASGTSSSGNNLQGAYDNGQAITVAPGIPVYINGTLGQKLLHVAGDVQIDGLLDPTGLQLTPQTTCPIPSGDLGIWIDSTEKLQFRKANNTDLAVSTILETLSGNAPNFKRRMTNNTGITIPAGSAVYMSGDNQIALAETDVEDHSHFFGITAATCPDGTSVEVIFTGVAPGIMALSGLPTNTRIWLSPTPGTYSDTPPGPGSYQVQIGLVCGDDLILQIQNYGLAN